MEPPHTAKAVSPFVPHSATALHAFASARTAQVWSAVGRAKPATPLWLENVPLCPYAKNIPPSLTAASVLHFVVCAGAMSSRHPAKAVSAFVPHSATALHTLAAHGQRQTAATMQAFLLRPSAAPDHGGGCAGRHRIRPNIRGLTNLRARGWRSRCRSERCCQCGPLNQRSS